MRITRAVLSQNPRYGDHGSWRLGVLMMIVILGVALWTGPASKAQGASSPTSPVAAARLVQPEDLSYVGAFRLPQGSGSEQTFEYGGTALTYYAAHDSLVLVGHDWHQRAAEVSIPAIANNATVSGLARAVFRQPFTDVLEGQIGLIGGGNRKIGGFLIWGDTLITSAYLYYDGNGDQALSHFRSGVDFSRTGDVQGPFQVGSARAGFVSGYMTPIPGEWQTALGGPALTGQCCLSIISRTSLGPAASVFAPTDVGVKNPVPAKAVLGYPITNATLGALDQQNPDFNGTTTMAGVVFPGGTRSVLFFGRHGLGPYCYGTGGVTGGDCVDPTGEAKGNHAYPYAYQIWAYDALNLVAVKEGRKRPWEIKPYKVWTFELPFAHVTRLLGGVAYDPATNRVFLSASYADGGQPLVHVLTLRTRSRSQAS